MSRKVGNDRFGRAVSPDEVGGEALQDCGVDEAARPSSTRTQGGRDGRRSECKECTKARQPRVVPRRTASATIDARSDGSDENPERYQATPAPVRRERQEEGLRSQEPSEAQVRAHARAIRRDARRPERRMRHLRRAAARGSNASCRPRPRRRARSAGSLCFKCNDALGDFNDDHDLFQRAADYLDRDTELAEMARTRARALAL